MLCRNINLNISIACHIFIIYSPGIPPSTQPQGFIPFMFKSNILRVVGILIQTFYYIKVIKLSTKLFVHSPHQDTEPLQYFVVCSIKHKPPSTYSVAILPRSLHVIGFIYISLFHTWNISLINIHSLIRLFLEPPQNWYLEVFKSTSIFCFIRET